MQIGQIGKTNQDSYNTNNVNLRDETIINYLKSKGEENKNDYALIIEKYVIPGLENLINKLKANDEGDNINKAMCNKINEDIKKLYKAIETSTLIPEKVFNSNMPQSRIQKLLQTNSDKKIENQSNGNTTDSKNQKSLVCNKELFENLKLWVKEFFSDKRLLMNFPYNDIQNKNLLKQKSNNKSDYLNFRDVTNPSLPTIVMNNLMSLSTAYLAKSYELVNEDTLKNYSSFKIQKLDIVKIWKSWNECFAEIGSEFRLKIVFAEFLTKFEKDQQEDKGKLEILQNFFLKICHEMYLLGYISRKKTKADIFIKNYYTLPRFRMTPGIKMDIV